jgi:hypothetical protein
VIKIILAVLFLFCCVSIKPAVGFEPGDAWVSNRYKKPGTEYRQDDRTIVMKNIGPFEKDFVFRKSGRNSYQAYDDETGNFWEMKIKRNGDKETYEYETGDTYR